ncbi:DUF4365 domain-containing protein [Acinetobacter towneri]|uniref:DUF4365 domain-containing protein n=1 Tax=Acinetobacter towneri TaxID=202956 RepID=UPI00336BE866
MPKRIDTHRIDTKAVRTIFTHLNENWLVRSLEERDYGIDLQLERFDSDDATGDFIFVQVKGTDKAFKENVQLSGFPVDTVNYALMFDVPFFLFHTSNVSKQTKYVWLQNYVETRLEKDTPQWKTQDSVTIYFPDENNLKSNDSKIADIIKKDKLRKVGVKFLAIYESLKFHSESVLTGQPAVAHGCAIEARKLQKLSSFINEYKELVFEGNYTDFNTFHEAYDNIANTLEIDSMDKETISSAMKFLEGIKFTFLNQDEINDFAEDMGSYHPY